MNTVFKIPLRQLQVMSNFAPYWCQIVQMVALAAERKRAQQTSFSKYPKRKIILFRRVIVAKQWSNI